MSRVQALSGLPRESFNCQKHVAFISNFWVIVGCLTLRGAILPNKKTIWPQTDLCLFLFIIDQTRISMKEKAKSTEIMLRLTPLLLLLEDVSVLTNPFSLVVRIDIYLLKCTLKGCLIKCTGNALLTLLENVFIVKVLCGKKNFLYSEHFGLIWKEVD